MEKSISLLVIVHRGYKPTENSELLPLFVIQNLA